MPKKIGPLDQKQAIIVFALVAVGVFVFLKYRSKNAAAQSVSTAAATPTDTAYPQQAQDSTGGATGSPDNQDALAQLISSFTSNPPYYYNYSTGDTTTSTTNNYYGQGATSGSSGGGTTATSTPAPVSPGGGIFDPGQGYNPGGVNQPVPLPWQGYNPGGVNQPVPSSITTPLSGLTALLPVQSGSVVNVAPPAPSRTGKLLAV